MQYVANRVFMTSRVILRYTRFVGVNDDNLFIRDGESLREVNHGKILRDFHHDLIDIIRAFYATCKIIRVTC